MNIYHLLDNLDTWWFSFKDYLWDSGWFWEVVTAILVVALIVKIGHLLGDIKKRRA